MNFAAKKSNEIKGKRESLYGCGAHFNRIRCCGRAVCTMSSSIVKWFRRWKNVAANSFEIHVYSFHLQYVIWHKLACLFCVPSSLQSHQLQIDCCGAAKQTSWMKKQNRVSLRWNERAEWSHTTQRSVYKIDSTKWQFVILEHKNPSTK